MAHPGRPATKLQITDAERAELHARLRVRKAPEDEAAHANRAGLRRWGVGTMIAQRLGTTVQTVSKWRRALPGVSSGGFDLMPRALAARAVWATSRFSSLWTRFARASLTTPRTGACAR